MLVVTSASHQSLSICFRFSLFVRMVSFCALCYSSLSVYLCECVFLYQFVQWAFTSTLSCFLEMSIFVVTAPCSFYSFFAEFRFALEFQTYTNRKVSSSFEGLFWWNLISSHFLSHCHTRHENNNTTQNDEEKVFKSIYQLISNCNSITHLLKLLAWCEAIFRERAKTFN